MTSIKTNASALQAAQALNAASDELRRSQQRVATGLKIERPTDNAAVYAIAQGMRADLGGLQAAGQSLERGRGMLDVAMAAAGTISDLLVELKGKAIAYADTSLDPVSRDTIRADMLAIVRQVDQTASNAEFSGVNLLKPVTEPPVTLSFPAGGPNPTVNFTTPVDGRTGLVTFTYSLYNANPTPAPTAAVVGTQADYTDVYGVSSSYGQTTTYTRALPYGDVLNFEQQDPSVVSFSAHASPFPIPPFPAPAPPVPYGFTMLDVTHTPFRKAEKVIANADGEPLELIYRPMTAEWLGLSNLGSATPDAVLDRVTSALAQVNASTERIGVEQGLVENLLAQNSKRQDAVEGGVGNLVDADMAREAARLQALQVRQQLAAQTSSIANAQPQWLLTLFGGG